jgi:hypothetical protein
MSFSATLPKLASVYTLGVQCMYGFYVMTVVQKVLNQAETCSTGKTYGISVP